MGFLVPIVREHGGSQFREVINCFLAVKTEDDVMLACRTARNESRACPPCGEPLSHSGRFAQEFEPEINPCDSVIAAGPGTGELFLMVDDVRWRLAFEA